MDEVPALRIRHVAFERVQISAVLNVTSRGDDPGAHARNVVAKN